MARAGIRARVAGPASDLAISTLPSFFVSCRRAPDHMPTDSPVSFANHRPPIAVIGTGLVGSGWAIVFARAGFPVRLFDGANGAAEKGRAAIAERLADLESFGLLSDRPDTILSRITVAATMPDALAGAAYVQESVFERVDVKKQLMAELESCLPDDTIVGSSSSGIPASAFTEEAARIRSRVLIVHPVNPPYLIPVVELVPAPWTAPAAVDFAEALMLAVKQSPVRVRREVEGFVINRLQGVLLREAWALVEEGVCSVEDADKAMRDGLGWRWFFMGPFETIDLNAPGGVADYARRLGPLYRSIAASRTHDQEWSENLIGQVDQERRAELPLEQLPDRSAWRDRRLMALAAQRRQTESSAAAEGGSGGGAA